MENSKKNNVMQNIIIHNFDKGIILLNVPEEEDRFNTMLKGNQIFYSPYKNEKNLRCAEVYALNKNSIGFKNFKKVQFHFTGENGTGVTTSYNCNIYTQPDSEQLSFIGKSKIEYITFEN